MRSNNSGTLQVDGTLHIETEDAVGINHASNSITAQSLYLETKTRGNGALTSTTSADAYRMTAGTGNFTDASTIISRGRGVVFTAHRARSIWVSAALALRRKPTLRNSESARLPAFRQTRPPSSSSMRLSPPTP